MRKYHLRIKIILLCLYLFTSAVSAQQYVVPGGQVVGIELDNDHVIVTAVDDLYRLKKNQMQPGDEIIAINGKKVKNVNDIKSELMCSDGAVDLKVMRGGQIKAFKMVPEATAQGPKLGVYLKQGVSGIGTLTWYDPQNGSFGALGHGVNDRCGKLMEISDGKVFSANVISIKRGISGTPGQLHGAADVMIGELNENRNSGVFGKLNVTADSKPMEVASFEEIQTGTAKIRCTVESDVPQEYFVEILKIYPDADNGGKNLLIKVKDQRLLDATGGIVQGMSGSPIIQNGKIIGAVTHVFTNDPTKGYGIYIGNMLNHAK